MPIRPCPSGCGRFLSADDGHDRCLQCLGFQHGPSQAPSRPGSRRSGPDVGNPEMLEFTLSQETVRTAPLLPPVEGQEEHLPFHSRCRFVRVLLVVVVSCLRMMDTIVVFSVWASNTVPARPQVVQEVDEAALTWATRRCWNLLFLRRR